MGLVRPVIVDHETTFMFFNFFSFFKVLISDHRTNTIDHRTNIFDHRTNTIDHKTNIFDHKANTFDHRTNTFFFVKKRVIQILKKFLSFETDLISYLPCWKQATITTFNRLIIIDSIDR